jgi:AcrR family transcriptional regulator
MMDGETMPRPSQEAKILEAALRCFADLGYDATRVRHIADAAGVSEGALYRHFESKEALAHELFARYMSAYVAVLQDIADRPLSVRERLMAMVYATMDTYRAQPDATYFILLGPSKLYTAMEPGFRFPLEVVEDVIREGQQSGIVRDGQPNLLAAIYLGCTARPIIVARLADPGALDLPHEPQHDAVIAEASWAALACPGTSD